MRKRKLSILIAAALVFALSSLARAGSGTVPCYSTGTNGLNSVEKAAQVKTAPTTFTLLVATNYDTVNPKVVMLFDSNAAPSTGAIPLMQIALPVATSANQPAQLSLAIPGDGTPLVNGLYVGCSSTGKTFTLDSAANCAFLACTH